MPIYEYRRPDGTTFDVIQRFSDDALTHDPETGVPVIRVLSAPAVHFKGKGFYNTDYGTKKRQRELKDSADSGAEKTESKSAEKAEAKSSSGESTSTSGGDSKPAKSESSTKKAA
jgi:putative FmdB family regulatory protein